MNILDKDTIDEENVKENEVKCDKNIIINIKNSINKYLDFNSFSNPSALATSFDIWALGFSVVIGGQMYGWNAALTTGFGSFGIAQFLMGTAYVCLLLCIAEIGSTIPFTGGCYGLGKNTHF